MHCGAIGIRAFTDCLHEDPASVLDQQPRREARRETARLVHRVDHAAADPLLDRVADAKGKLIPMNPHSSRGWVRGKHPA